MILFEEINAIAERFGVAVETIEKDYIIAWILTCLAKSKLKDNFIFYGGTAIKRIYFENHRFSEDIDLLSPKKFSLDEIIQELSILHYSKEAINLTLEIKPGSISVDKHRIQLIISYDGYENIIGAPKEIRIDFVMDMDLFGETQHLPIIKTYSDLSAHNETLSVMTLNTIFANKIGLLLDITRNEPRDLYDIWFLLQHKDEFDFDVKKIKYIFKEKYSYSPSLTILNSGLNNSVYKKNWDFRLARQVSQLPDVEIVLRNIQDKFKKMNF